VDICVFPFTNIDFSIQKNLFGDSIYSNIQSQRGISLKQFIFNRFSSIKNKIESKHNFKFGNLSKQEIIDIRNILSPSLNDQNLFINNQETYEWLGLKNFEVFSGLSKNQRILIEGIPGCGKTTFALAFADQRRHLKGLYLCWNRMLKVVIEYKSKERGLMNLEINTYFTFLKDSGLKNINISDSTSQLREKIMDFFVMNSFKQYDYIIIDEGQDLINKGIDFFLDKSCGNGKGLENGNILFLCDNEQAYTSSDEKISDEIDLLSLFFTHYQMNQSHRSVNNPQIRDLASLILEDVNQLDSTNVIDYYPNVIKRFSSFKDAKKVMVRDFLTPIRNKDNSLKGKDCILLIESNLLSKSEIVDELVMNDCEELTEHNVSDNSNILRYTSPLKYKGLEKENVAFIVKQPSAINQYELYVGITRAKSNLKIYLVYE
jgi:hypothetical protein